MDCYSFNIRLFIVLRKPFIVQPLIIDALKGFFKWLVISWFSGYQPTTPTYPQGCVQDNIKAGATGLWLFSVIGYESQVH